MHAVAIDPRRISRILACIALGLSAAGTAVRLFQVLTGHNSIFGIFTKFDLDTEANLPTWFSASVLLVAALLLLLIQQDARRRHDPFATHWAVLAGGFFLMSIDELVQLHEMLIRPLAGLFGRSGFFAFTWVVPALGVIAVVAVLYTRFVAHLPQQTRRLMMLSATVYLGGAVGLEMFGAWCFQHFGPLSWQYGIETVTEESMEMIGAVLFVHTLLGYATRLGLVAGRTAEAEGSATAGPRR